jgi:hypothetical protein
MIWLVCMRVFHFNQKQLRQDKGVPSNQ